jgi:hypothetical protein
MHAEVVDGGLTLLIHLNGSASNSWLAYTDPSNCDRVRQLSFRSETVFGNEDILAETSCEPLLTRRLCRVMLAKRSASEFGLGATVVRPVKGKSESPVCRKYGWRKASSPETWKNIRE